MNNSPAFYFESLYPLQDRVIEVIRQIETGFYLSGGTAASRGYLRHRFSDDLDYFVNDDDRFTLWSARIIHELSKRWKCEILLREERFSRINLLADVTLKIEMLNDVPARVGIVQEHPTLGKLDTAENILANKVTAILDREEPKDMADVWGFCAQLGLSLESAITNAQSKAAGVFPADLARVLCSVRHEDWEAIRWIQAPPVEMFIGQLNALGERLLLP